MTRDESKELRDEYYNERGKKNTRRERDRMGERETEGGRVKSDESEYNRLYL